MGDVAPGTYLVLALAPGVHHVAVLTSEHTATLPLEVAAGQVALSIWCP